MAAADGPYVFLSYSRADRERALALSDTLEAAGVPVWLDREAITGGTSWGTEIVEGIRDCTALVILCSGTAMQSRNVRQEIQLAWRYERPYVPLLLEQVDFPEQVQYFLEGYQWVELLERPQEQWLPDLARALGRLGVPLTFGDATAAAPVEPVVPTTAAEPLAADRGQGFVGRAAELGTLQAALEETAKGEGRLVLLVGEPGIGKTRLAQQTADQAVREGWRVLWGRCWEGEGAPAFWPWMQLLGTFARSQEPAALQRALGRAAADVAALVPEVRALLPDLPAPPASEPEQARFRLFGGITALLSGVALEQPLLLILDDLHWADKPSLLLLQFLARELSAGRVLVLGTYRDTDLDRSHPLADTLAGLRREQAFTRVALGGFSVDEVLALMEARAGYALGVPARALAEAIWRETEGNPFFVSETLRHLAESGALTLTDGRWTASRPVDSLGIPEGVREVIGRRLSRLSPEANTLLAQAAVAGREFDEAVLRSVADVDQAVLDRALEEALAAAVIVETRGRGLPGYSFSHALIRQTLYEELRVSRRQRLHVRVAEAIEQVHARGLERFVAVLAMHYREAGAAADPEKAIDYSVRAGEAAVAVFAWEDALAQWQTAVDEMEEAGGFDPRKLDLLLRMGRLFMDTGVTNYPRAVATFERALTLAERLHDQEQQAVAHFSLAGALAHFGPQQDLARGAEHERAAEALLTLLPASERLEELSAGAGAVGFAGMHSVAGLARAERGLAFAERRGDERLAARLRWRQGWFRFSQGAIGDGLALIEQAWTLADRMDDVYTGYMAAIWRSSAARLIFDPRDALAWAERELNRPRQARSANHEVLQSSVAHNLLIAGDPSGAREIAASPTGAGPLAVARLELDGAWEAALEVQLATVASNRRSGNRYVVSAGNTFAARVRMLLRLYDEAEAGLQEALDLAVDGPHVPLELRARVELAVLLAQTGRAGEAAPHLKRLREILAGGEDWRGAPGKVAQAEGEVAAALGRREEAAGRFARAVEILRRYTNPLEEAEVLVAWGRMLLAASDGPGATVHLDGAAAIYARIGAGQRWAARIAPDRARAISPP